MAEHITPEQLAAWRELTDKATPGPWRFIIRGNSVVSYAINGVCYNISPKTSNAQFIAASREALPALLDEVERLRGENAQVRREVWKRMRRNCNISAINDCDYGCDMGENRPPCAYDTCPLLIEEE